MEILCRLSFPIDSNGETSAHTLLLTCPETVPPSKMETSFMNQIFTSYQAHETGDFPENKLSRISAPTPYSEYADNLSPLCVQMKPMTFDSQT